MSRTILVVDDSSSLRTVVRMALERAAYRVVEASNGQQALNALEAADKVNLVVCDVNMPEMDGLTFVSHLKQHPRHKFVPVVLLTTEGDADMKAKGRAAGARAWIVKPFLPPQLVDAVSRLALP